MKYYTVCKKTGRVIDEFNSIEKAKNAVFDYGEIDYLNNEYCDNSYFIIDENNITIEY